MVVYEKYIIGDDGDSSICEIYWRAQSFTPQENQTITSIKIKVFKIGTPTDPLKVEVWSTAAGKPNAKLSSFSDVAPGSITTTPGSFVTSTGSQALTADVMYAIILYTANTCANRFYWRADNSSPTYTRGTFLTSGDSGSTWGIIDGSDGMFETDGATPPPPPAESSISMGRSKNRIIHPEAEAISMGSNRREFIHS